ncbi:hypothetical protein [Sulfidibacter corallicola]|uniref:hypothetical protein n=1 Tax=Sulfidibacter corallicola TaxID=2818388 RepID=UPI001F2C57AD|nr:hypothetical protein [Sulfidibacter corallicola]
MKGRLFLGLLGNHGQGLYIERVADTSTQQHQILRRFGQFLDFFRKKFGNIFSHLLGIQPYQIPNPATALPFMVKNALISQALKELL